MVFLLVVSFFLSAATCILLIRRLNAHARHYQEDKPQRFHAGNTPRIGGVGILVGVATGWILAVLAPIVGLNANTQMTWALSLSLLVLALPAVLGGVYEDVSQRLSVRYRLVLTAISAALACGLLGLSITRLGLPGVDGLLLTAPWLGVGVAFFAICGLPHAFNLIDGYNGLAGTVALFICLAIAYVALQLGDRQLAVIVICLAGATAGFLVWNYPRGLIFAGDGGAYLWGVVVAVASILIVQRHETVSPWFPMLLLIYPVWETVFSIYRKLARGSSPGVADALHFHQLIYRRIVRGVFHDDASRRMLMRNNRTSPYLWSFTLMTVVPAMLFWGNTYVLMGFSAMFVLIYVAAYIAIIRFKVPRWLR
ncbi:MULTISPECIES: glycosyltransferase family 4 protein [Polaromonas]|uniref:Glycosyltransferase family 4 protein n=1 Tax=Polaromonas aquatica TaxID=332657 RepID=A0ABW1U141_9BURK